jgi:pimeloyl-ACP methyl ester carboxylesterase
LKLLILVTIFAAQSKFMELNFKVYGQGEPLIIMHGMFGMLDNWQLIAKKLSETFMVFLVDLRNHGRSPHSEEFGYQIMSDDLLRFMNENWIHHAHIVGHSMGGKVAMRFALENPDMIDKLVVVDIAPKTYEGNHESIIDALIGLDLSKLTSRTDAEIYFRKLINEESTIQFLLKNLSREKDGNYRWKMNLPVIVSKYQEILGHEHTDEQFDGPTLFIRGQNSDYINPDEFNDYKHNFPDAKLITISNAGHWVHAESPDAFLKELLNFLN